MSLLALGAMSCDEVASTSSSASTNTELFCDPSGLCEIGVCDTTTNKCVECLSSQDCDTGVCDLTNHVCTGCSTDGDCSEGVCNTTNHMCVDCKTDSDCSEGVCDIQSHTCVECLNSSHCTDEAKAVCDTTLNKCVPCDDSHACDDSKCVEGKCVACVEDSDCSQGVCESGSCVECRTASDCASDVCVANTCRECDDLHPCSSGLKCASKGEAANTCVACTEDADCTEGVCATDKGVCAECNTDSDCSAKYPDGSKPGCVLSGEKAHTCAACTSNEHCTTPELPVCSTEENVCVTCMTNDDCEGDNVCLTDTHTCAECAVSTDCVVAEKPICLTDGDVNTCSACTSDTQCADKNISKSHCLLDTGACVECIEANECTVGVCDLNTNMCVECTKQEDCTDISKGVCVLEGENANKCEPCDEKTNCYAHVCSAETGKCEPCSETLACPTDELGVCVSGTCEACDETTNCDLMCYQGHCVACDEKTNCSGVCYAVTEKCEPCNNTDMKCTHGVCNVESGICEACDENTNCLNGTCGTDGLCHISCTNGTLCGHSFLDETCCKGTEICTTYSTCIVPGDGCRTDSDCSIFDKCDIPEGQQTGHCVPVASDPEACFNIPTFEAIAPSVQWHYTNPSKPTSVGVVSTPIVIDLTHDGIPEVVFTDNNYTVTALSGDTGEVYAVSSDYIYNKHNDIAAGDIDNDGEIEVIVPSASSKAAATGLYILNLVKNGSTYQWNQKSYIPISTKDLTEGSGIYWADVHPSIADIDEDGIPEVVTTRGIIKGNNLSDFHCTMKMGQFSTWYHYMFAIADLDQDGESEIIADLMYDKDCKITMKGAEGWGYAAVADMLPTAGEEGELVPEIVRVKGINVNEGYVGVWKVYKNNGVWTQKQIWKTQHPGGGGGNPVIADFNGDGMPEIGVAGGKKFAVFNGQTGKVLWSVTTDDTSSYRTGAAVFDFEADGKSEVVYRDHQKIRIYNGSDGKELWSDNLTSGTVIDYPLIVDVDGDGKTEIVVGSEKKGSYSYSRLGLTVYADTYGKWVPTRKIWNQHSYHVTNINDDGSVPMHEEANWLNKRLNNYRANTQPEGFYNQPNFVPGLLVEDKTKCYETPAILGLKATIANVGDKSMNSEIQISWYIESADGANKYYIGTKAISGLAANDKTTVTLDWDSKTAWPVIHDEISDTSVELTDIQNYKALFVVDDAANTGKTQYDECHEDDNSLATSRILTLTGCKK